MAELAVEIDAVSHAYGSHQALKDVSFNVQKHAFFGLLGPNGSGKTTLFRIISSLLAPGSGSCTVMGHETIHAPKNVRMNLGVVFQQPSLDDALTVRQNLTFHGALYSIGSSDLKKRIEYLSTKLQIKDRLDSKVGQLSGGLKRRADLVRGLLHQPRLLLLDEPTTGLDPIARHDFWQLLSSIRKEEGITMILATHLLDEAESCDDVVIMDTGKVTVQGNPESLRENLGDKMLWLTSVNPSELASRLKSDFGFDVSEVDGALCIKDGRAVQSLPSLYESMPGLIESATVRNPTLEDVFLMYAHRSFSSAHQDAEPIPSKH